MKKPIFIVTQGSYDDLTIVAAFGDEKAAELYIERHTFEYGDPGYDEYPFYETYQDVYHTYKTDMLQLIAIGDAITVNAITDSEGVVIKKDITDAQIIAMSERFGQLNKVGELPDGTKAYEMVTYGKSEMQASHDMRDLIGRENWEERGCQLLSW